MPDATNDTPWRDAEVVREMYHGRLMTTSEIADELGCSRSTISEWLGRHDIDRRTPAETRELRGTNHRPIKDGPHHNPEWLREKYHGEGLSLEEMADEAGVESGVTILRHMEEHGIGRRELGEHLRKRDRKSNRERAKPYDVLYVEADGKQYRFDHHRLLAIAKFGIGPVKESVVHHKNGNVWDNRFENLELIDSQSDHAKLHLSARTRDEYGRFV